MNFKPCFAVLVLFLVASSVSSQCTISETDNSLTAIFTKIYMYALAAYQPWDVVFNVDTPADEVTQIYYDIVYNVGTYFNISDEENADVATDVSTSVGETIEYMTPCGYGEVYGIAAANNLVNRGNLTNDNAVYTAWLYANYTRDCMMSEEYETNHPCLATGFIQINAAAYVSSNESYDELGVVFDDAVYQVYNALIGNSTTEQM